MKSRMRGKKILLAISGGISAYKMPDVVHGWMKAGCEVEIMMTEAAEKFVSPLSLSTLTGRRVWFERDFLSAEHGWKIPHIKLTERADILVVAPCTANVLRICAQGDGSTLIGASVLACTKPKILFPAMNSNMLENGATQEHMKRAEELGFEIAESEEGLLACGYIGKGRLPSSEVIDSYIERALYPKKDLAGKKVLVTAGPTHEYIDPVRYISNPSSGKMGFEVARNAYYRGAEVVLVSGPVNIAPPFGVRVIETVSARQMYDACIAEAPECSIIVKAAAVGDFRAADMKAHKIKRRKGEPMTVELVQNPDIAAELGRRKKLGQVLIGFAAETDDLIENAKRKIESKNLDMIAVNDILAKDAGFKTDTNRVSLITADGKRFDIAGTKDEVAEAILDRAAEL
jgi:phosphopantothenoylcysteine decarboxylase/phosphopantothenate--cysteine ligase